MQPDDAELVNRSQKGDLGAFNMIVERYQTQVFNVSVRLLSNAASAEDATQEAFISAYKAIGRFRGGSLRAWLLRIATNTSYDAMPASRRRPALSLDQSMQNPGFREPAGGESPEQLALRGELGAEYNAPSRPCPTTRRQSWCLLMSKG